MDDKEMTQREVFAQAGQFLTRIENLASRLIDDTDAEARGRRGGIEDVILFLMRCKNDPSIVKSHANASPSDRFTDLAEAMRDALLGVGTGKG